MSLKILLEIDRICKKFDIRYSIAYGTMLGAVRHKGYIPWDDDIDVWLPREDYVKFREVCKTDLGSDFFYQTNETDSEYYYLYDKIRNNGTIFRETFVEKYNIHHGVFVDIFPMDRIPKNSFFYWVQFLTFHYYRAGLMSKYLMISSRHGLKRIAAILLRLLYLPFKLRWLYNQAQNVACHYQNRDGAYDVGCLYSPYKIKDIHDDDIWNEIIDCSFENRNIRMMKSYDKVLKNIYGDYMQLPPLEKRVTIHSLKELSI